MSPAVHPSRKPGDFIGIEMTETAILLARAFASVHMLYEVAEKLSQRGNRRRNRLRQQFVGM